MANVNLPRKPSGVIGRHRQSVLNQAQKPERGTKKDIGERAVDWLVARIVSVRKELDLFEEISEEFPGINLESWEDVQDGLSDCTRMLVRLFDVIGTAVEKGEKSVLSGLIMLWARERVCYSLTLEKSHGANNITGTARSMERRQNQHGNQIRPERKRDGS